VYKWNDHVLDGCTYEEAQRIVAMDSLQDTVEIHVKKCRYAKPCVCVWVNYALLLTALPQPW